VSSTTSSQSQLPACQIIEFDRIQTVHRHLEDGM
jgi:hypothetical protein